jgi:UDP-N-acetylmuramoyl-tripeptide--D-alanyl-D-alanine ligase
VAESNLTGNYNLINLAAAACVGSFFGISNQEIKNAIEAYKPANNRSQLIEKNGNQFIVDCYNANPSSMKLAIESFAEMPVENKIAIVGDMFELGSHSEFEHLQIAHQLNNSSFKKVIIVGNEFSKLKDKFNHFISFETTTELKQWMNEQQFTNHTFLLKASRGMALEKLLD